MAHRWLRGLLLCLGLGLGAIYAYSYRFAMNPDGIGYIDVANAYFRHDWATAINGYWSPVYSWILATFLYIFRPTSRTEFPLVHLVNFLCFAWTSWSFHRFWQAVSSSVRRSNHQLVGLPTLAPLAFDLFGYSLYFWLFLPLIPTVTPDLLGSSFIFLIADRLLRRQTRGSDRLRDGAALGLLFAIAYLTKAIMFYFSIFTLVIALVDRRISRRRTLLISALTFAFLIAPWVIALHETFGRWTLGFSGQLNYAWLVDGTETGTIEPNGAGAPLPYFPGRRIFTDPAIYEVQTKSNITYLPWYDASRFDHSHHPQFQWRRQLAAVKGNLGWLTEWVFVNLGPMTVVALALLAASGAAAATAFSRYVTIAFPAAAMVGMYVLVTVRTPRYVAAVAVVLFSLGLASVRLERANKALASAILVGGLIVFAVTNLPGAMNIVSGLSDQGSNPVVEAAEAIRSSGVEPNTRICTVGAGVYAYWAHLAGVNIGAEIWNSEVPLFWNADLSRRNSMLCAMGNSGVFAVVGAAPANADLSGWEPLGHSGYWMYRVPERACQTK